MSDSDSEGDVPAKKARIAYYYGDEKMTDVVFIVENSEFHAHQSFLVIRSTYLKELFATHPPAENGKISITIDEKADPRLMMNQERDFRYLMNMLTSSSMERVIIPWFANEWGCLSNVMRLAEKFEVVDVVRPVMERYFLLSFCGQPTCILCGTRCMVALHFNWRKAINRMKTSVRTLADVLVTVDYSSYIPVFHITPATFLELIDRANRVNMLDIDAYDDFSREDDSSKEDDPAGDDNSVGDEADEENEEKAAPEVFEYGGVESDVTLSVGNSEFKVHKQYLAMHSPVFSAMFLSGFKEKYEEKVPIEADAVVFKVLMDILYDGKISDHIDGISCHKYDSDTRILRFWELLLCVMELFDYYNLPLRLVEASLLRAPWCGKADCIECASKKLFAKHYNLESLDETLHSNTEAIASCLRNYQYVLPDPLSMFATDIARILENAVKNSPLD